MNCARCSMPILPGRGAFCAFCLSTGGDFPLLQSAATKRIKTDSPNAGDQTVPLTPSSADNKAPAGGETLR